MKEGDIIDWKSVNRVEHGKIVLSKSGEFIVRLDNGHTFTLEDLRHSSSAKLIEI